MVGARKVEMATAADTISGGKVGPGSGEEGADNDATAGTGRGAGVRAA